MKSGWPRAFVGLAWGLCLFLAIAWGVKLATGSLANISPAASQVMLKAALILISMAAWKLLGGNYADMGWRRGGLPRGAQVPWHAIAVLAMMAGSVAMVLLELRHPLMAQMTFLQIVLSVWLLSSVSEEVYVRGLVQSWMRRRHEDIDPIPLSEPSIVMSSLLFAAMHVPLMWSPIGIAGGLIIVLATLAVGFACAVLRARSGSLWPAIVCHILGNVAGVPGGIIGVIIYRLIHGRLPEMLSAG